MGGQEMREMFDLWNKSSVEKLRLTVFIICGSLNAWGPNASF
jgi:hypothetical protein